MSRCTRTAGAQELVTDDITGRLVDVGNKQALAEAITELLEHPDKAYRFALNFHQQIRTHLSWQHTFDEYLQVAMSDRTGICALTR